MCGHRLFCRIQVSDPHQNRKIHVGRILESDIPIIPEFLQYMDIGSFVGYKYPTDVETEKSMWVGFSNPTFQSFPNFCNIWTSAFLVGYQYPTYVETEKSMWVGFSNPTFQSFPNFCNVWTSVFFVGYKYPTRIKTEKSMWVGFSNPTFQSFPNFCNVWTSAFSCRIPVSDLRRNRKIHVGRILESDIPIIPEFLQCVKIGSFVGYKYPTYVETEQSM